MKRIVPSTRGMLVVSLLALGSGRAGAQGTARVLDLDPSAISVGMGGAGAAMWWSAEPNYWANPALLGYYQGVRFQGSYSQLLPELASDIRYDTKRWTLGGGGVGLEISGRSKLSYGVSNGTDPMGNPTGPFESYEQVKATGFGVSLGRVADAIASASGHPLPAALRWVDVAGGWASKPTDVSPFPGDVASATPKDYGFLFALGGAVGDPSGPRLVIAGSYSHSERNYDRTTFYFPLEDMAVLPERMIIDGGAARIGVEKRLDQGTSGFAAVMLRGLDPLVAVDWAYDHTQDKDRVDYAFWGSGFQISALNVISVRFGNFTDVLGGIDGGTRGIGVALPVGDFGGARFDYGTTPLASGTGLSDEVRRSYSFWIDPNAIWRAAHRATP